MSSIHIFSSLNSLLWLNVTFFEFVNICWCTDNDDEWKKRNFTLLIWIITVLYTKWSKWKADEEEFAIYSRYLSLLYKHHLLCVKKKKNWKRRNFWHWLKRHIRKFTFFCVCAAALNEWWWMQSLIKFHLWLGKRVVAKKYE